MRPPMPVRVPADRRREPEDTRVGQGKIRGVVDPRAEGPGARPRAAGHVHADDRPDAHHPGGRSTTPPTRRWRGRPRASTCACTPTARSRVEDDGRGIPVGAAPRGEGLDRRGRVHAPARGRQVRQEGRAGRLRVLGRPARRRRVGDQRAVAAARGRGQARRQGAPHRLRGRRRRGEAEGRSAPAASARPAPRCAPGPTRSTSIRRRCRCRSSSGCCAPRRCCCPASRSRSHVEKGKEWKTQTWSYPGGLTGLPAASWATAWSRSRRSSPARPTSASRRTARPSPRARAPRGRSPGTRRARAAGESYVNLIPTPAGGTHEAGLRAALFEAVKAFVDHHGLLPRGARLQTEDVVGEAALRALRAHARPAVPGAGQGEAHQPRRAEADRAGGPGPARGLAQPARRLRQAHRRARDPAGADADEVGAEGREAEGLRRRGAAGQAHRLRIRRRRRAARSSWSRAIRPAARPSRRATSSTRRSCRCAARC